MYSTDQDASLIPALGSGPFPNTSGEEFGGCGYVDVRVWMIFLCFKLCLNARMRVGVAKMSQPCEDF